MANCMSVQWESIADCFSVAADIATTIGLPVTAIGVFMAALTIRANRKNQAMSLALDHALLLCRDQELVDAAHYLIYTYSPSRFIKVEEKLRDLLKEKMELLKEVPILRKKRNFEGERRVAERSIELQKEMFQLLEEMNEQDERKEGQRLYHPKLFQGSVEEKRLDNLLIYLSSIAYYCHPDSKLLSKKDMEGTFGWLFVLAAKSPVVRDYLTFIKSQYEEHGYDKLFGEQPFGYLNKLIKEYWPEDGTKG